MSIYLDNSATTKMCIQAKEKMLEAIKIELTNAPKGYHVAYQVHVQDIGWQNWCYDGETAGTQTLSKRAEAIEIQIVDKIKEEKVKLTKKGKNIYNNQIFDKNVNKW